MRRLPSFAILTLLTACAHHPVDCAIGVPWHGCLPGTQGYSNGGGGDTRAEQAAQEAADAPAADDAKCRSYGFVAGTQPYAECRQKFDLVRMSRPAVTPGPAVVPLVVAPIATPAPYQLPVPTVSRPTTTNCVRNGNFTNCTTN